MNPSIFAALCTAHGLPEPVAEYKFHPTRKWRFDFCWIEAKIVIEVDGGVFSQGRHTRGKGFIADQEKLNEATIAGWRVIRCVPQDVKTGKVFELLKRLFT